MSTHIYLYYIAIYKKKKKNLKFSAGLCSQDDVCASVPDGGHAARTA
jgi:hypothetical protein